MESKSLDQGGVRVGEVAAIPFLCLQEDQASSSEGRLAQPPTLHRDEGNLEGSQSSVQGDERNAASDL